MFKFYSDKRVILGIKKGELKIYEYLYKRFYKQIINHVKHNGSVNPKEDGNDLYQDTIIEIIRSVKDGRYQEKWKFGRTFEVIFKRRWLRILKERKNKPLSNIEKLQNQITEDITTGEVYDIYDYTKRLSKECQKIFREEKEGYSLKEIAKKQGISYNTIRKRKSRCLQRIRELMEIDNR